MKQLRGRVAVLTGAAGGVGRALARELARAEMDLVLADMDERGMATLAAELRDLGRRVLCVRTDVRELAQLEALLARTLQHFGSCHLLCSNAGVFTAAALRETSASAFQRVVDVNLWGVVHGARVFGAHFVAQGEGHIVHTASAAGLFPVPGMSAYSTSKFAVVGFSQQLRWELAAYGVGVTVLCPGVLRTRMARAEGVGLEHFDVEGLLRRAPGPEALAHKAVRAIRADRARVHYGFESWLFLWLRTWPSWLIDPLGRWVARRSLALVAGQATSPNTLGQPRR